MPVPILQIESLTHTLRLGADEIEILRGLTFRVERGEWVALMGPSGSGKSTLLGLVAALETPTAGRVLLDGQDVSHASERELAAVRNRRVGIVFQAFNLIPSLTALENVEAPLYVQRASNTRARARHLLEKVGLGHRLDHRPHQLSGGEQQRVAIARALVTEPALVVADEPTGNLDSKAGAAVLDLIAALRDELGLTILMVTHDAHVAARADRTLHLLDGRLVAAEEETA